MSEGPVAPANRVRENDGSIEVSGCLSRAQWEIVYLAAVQFAQKQGLTIERFDLRSTEIGDATAEPNPALIVT